MDGYTIQEEKQKFGAVIKVIGVGGGGGNMINSISAEKNSQIELLVANTDIQALEHSQAHIKIQLGAKKTRGLGAGMKPDIGKESALESYEEIKGNLEGADLVFISSGLGGGTGTGAAPVVAQAAKEVGALAVGVVTKPFRFEGRKRLKIAEKGLEDLKKECDSIIIIPNEKLREIAPDDMGADEAFKMVDNVLTRAVLGLSSVILDSAPGNINLDFADVTTTLSHRGVALMCTGSATGESAAMDALQQAINSPLLDDISIDGAMGVLINFQAPTGYPIKEISNAMDIIYDKMDDDDSETFLGLTMSEKIPEKTVYVTVIATGFEKNDASSNDVAINNKTKEQPINQINHESIQERLSQYRKVSGGSNYEGEVDAYDVPTYARMRQD